MSASREAFLERVRSAVRAGNEAGSMAAIGPRGQTGYSGGGADPVVRFCGLLCQFKSRRANHATHRFRLTETYPINTT